MKTILIALLLVALPAAAQVTTGSPDLDALIGKVPWLGQAVAWFGILSVIGAFIGRFAERKISDAVNRIAESSSMDDDTYLRKLFSHPAYKFAAFLSGFTPFKLKTLADFDRAIRLQNEAVAESKLVKR